jgi:hypothetical protein
MFGIILKVSVRLVKWSHSFTVVTYIMRNIENLSEFCTSVVGGLLSKSDKHCSTGVTIWGTGTAPREASHSPYRDAICGGPRINVYGPLFW